MSDAATATESSPGTDCPNCGAPQQAGRTSFCGVCGYSERFGRAGDLVVKDEVVTPSYAGLILCVVGIALIPLAAALVRCSLWEAPSHRLSAWLFWTFSVGSGMALLGHVLAWSACVARSDMDLSDLVCSPIRIWTMVFRLLPRGIMALCLFGFGLTTVGAGVLAFGVDYETMVRKSPPQTRETITSLVETVKSLMPDLSKLGSTTNESTESESDAVMLLKHANTTSPVSLSDAEVLAPAAPQLPESTSCLVIGYVEGVDGDLESLVLAVQENGALRYAGCVPVGNVEPAAFDDLTSNSLALTRPLSVIDCPVAAKWLVPDAVCRVDFAGRSESGELMKPHIVEVTEHLTDGK